MMPAPLGAPAVADAFARAMAAAGPFELEPHLAVAVSGGADSMALCVLARGWADAAGGRLTALIVDHDLRAGSAAEAAKVAEWMRSLGVAHRVLVWQGRKPSTAVQAQARAARYRLLVDWCVGAGVLHLLLGHHRGDQEETVLLRLLGGSRLRGLAGMAPALETAQLRLLRPLLDRRPEELRALLIARRQPWIDDPANHDQRFARSRLRVALAGASARGAGEPCALPASLPDQLADTTAAAVAARRAMDDAVAALLAETCTVYPGGWADLARTRFFAAAPEIATTALSRIVAMIGGAAQEPAAERTRRARARLLAGGDVSATLGRCRLMARGETLSVFRDRRRLPAPQPLASVGPAPWDGRFRLTTDRAASGAAQQLWVRPASSAERPSTLPLAADDPRSAAPYLVRVTLPILCDDHGRLVAALFGTTRMDEIVLQRCGVRARFRPRISVTGAGYFLVPANSSIIC